MLLRAATTLGKLRATSQPEPADAFVIAVPTPFNADRSPNLDYIDAAADAIAPALVSGNVVILNRPHRSARPSRLGPPTRSAAARSLLPSERHPEPLDVHVAHCPERVLPGRMVRELIENDRIIGGMTEACAEHAGGALPHLLAGETVSHRCADSRAGQAGGECVPRRQHRVCQRVVADLRPARPQCLAGHRDSPTAIPGSGYFSPDRVWAGTASPSIRGFIIASAPEHTRLIRTAREVNDAKPKFVVAQIRERAERFKRPVIACLGLTYKPDVDDLRESPAIEIAIGTGARRPGADPDRRSEFDGAARRTRGAPERLALRHPGGRPARRHRCPAGGSFPIPENSTRRVAGSRRHRR